MQKISSLTQLSFYLCLNHLYTIFTPNLTYTSISRTFFSFTYFYISCALNDQSCRCALKRHNNNNIALTLPLLHAFCLQLYFTACGVTRVYLIKDLTRLVGTERQCYVAEEQFQFVIDQCLDKVDP